MQRKKRTERQAGVRNRQFYKYEMVFNCKECKEKSAKNAKPGFGIDSFISMKNGIQPQRAKRKSNSVFLFAPIIGKSFM